MKNKTAIKTIDMTGPVFPNIREPNVKMEVRDNILQIHLMYPLGEKVLMSICSEVPCI
jgi:hypothetical protein